MVMFRSSSFHTLTLRVVSRGQPGQDLTLLLERKILALGVSPLGSGFGLAGVVFCFVVLFFLWRDVVF